MHCHRRRARRWRTTQRTRRPRQTIILLPVHHQRRITKISRLRMDTERRTTGTSSGDTVITIHRCPTGTDMVAEMADLVIGAEGSMGTHMGQMQLLGELPMSGEWE